MAPVLRSGRKPRKVERIKRGRLLGGEAEGEVFEVRITVKKKGREREIVLAEKEFAKGYPYDTGLVRNPVKQFELMQELKELNRRKKLGLHILPTIRLRKRQDGTHTLILTKYKESRVILSSSVDGKRILRQKKHEEQILKQNGYHLGPHVWQTIMDPITKKPTAYIADFGLISRIKQ